MTEIVNFETHAAAIERMHAWAVNDQFPRQLMRAIRTRLDHLSDSWSAFVRANTQLLLVVNEDDERNTYSQRYKDIEESYLHAAELMNERIFQSNQPQVETEGDDDDNNAEGRSVISHERSEGSSAEQPVVQVSQYTPGTNQIPWQCRLENTWGEFDGNYMKWPAFHDSFEHAVVNDQNIPLHRKLQLLKSSLKGRAERAFGEWLIRDQNFEPAWSRLKELFDDQYRTSKELLNRLLQLKKLDTPHGGRLQTMSNTVHEVVRQLEAMGYPPNEMTDMFIIHAVHERLDSQTSIAWDKFRDPVRPKLSELKKFLDREAKALINAYESTVVSKSNSRPGSKRPYTDNDNARSFKRFKPNTQSNGSKNGGNSNGHKGGNSWSGGKSVKFETKHCAVCSEEHLTRKCQKFQNLSLTKRKEKAREAKLCFNCLLPGCSARECSARPCSRCRDKKHNDLLCDENPQNRQLKVGQAKQVQGANNRRQNNKQRPNKQ